MKFPLIERIYHYTNKDKSTLSLSMPLSDIIDRMTIFTLKAQRLPENDAVSELLGIYSAAVEEELRGKSQRYRDTIDGLTKKLYEANKSIWDLEADLRNGKLDESLDLAEIGRRAIAIRDSNKKRITIKNEIAKLSGQYHGLDIKIDHASEE